MFGWEISNRTCPCLVIWIRKIQDCDSKALTLFHFSNKEHSNPLILWWTVVKNLQQAVVRTRRVSSSTFRRESVEHFSRGEVDKWFDPPHCAAKHCQSFLSLSQWDRNWKKTSQFCPLWLIMVNSCTPEIEIWLCTWLRILTLSYSSPEVYLR